MPLNAEGVSEMVYTNQSETVNSMLSAQKEEFGFRKKDDISKFMCIKSVWMGVVQQQEDEIEKALYGQSDRFRLSNRANHLLVDVETWFGMDETRRKVYLKQFRQLTPKDMEAKKGIIINELTMDTGMLVRTSFCIINEILYCLT